ncbi:hypothetical protein FSP39_009926 [Pinctada imbricata]|uniref:Ion transport domain-containing protein n=1 Tax=Pinctada imbricata TaxID=66713 RepID=A0AA89BWY5_PINIB|nr:hypothetical protein FSP39_009926 [Pinctada imbricata]
MNEDNLTPLELAFFLVSPRAIKFLNDLSLKETERKLLLSNIDSYRITEIDTITSRIVSDRKACFGILERRYRSKKESCLDLVFHNQMTRRKALETIQTKPVYFLIQEKWKKYWILITIFALLHFFIMSLITIYSIDRLKCVQGRNETEDSNQDTCRTSSEHIVDRHRSSIVAMSMLILVYDILSLVLDIFLLVSRFIFKPCRRLFLHNIDYALLHIIFTSSLLVDFIVMNVSESYGGSIVIISLLSGWGFFTFFLRTFYNFGKLIDMIRHVLVKDVPRFLAIMTLLLVAFSASLQVLFKNIEIEGHESIGDTLYSMFMVTLGIREVDIYQTISSVVTAILIITYLILGHIILLNSLIAVMTTNSYNISQNDEAHQYLHRLSVILFIEDMFLMICYISPVGEMKRTQERKQNPVFVLKLNDSSNSKRKGQ